MYNMFDAWQIGVAFVVGMITSWGVGWRIGRRLHPDPGEDPGSKFVDASMALLGLLLAFTFSMALGRHDSRRLAIVAESNSIADFYTCASLLKEEPRIKLQNLIREYAAQQARTFPVLMSGAAEAEELRRSQAMHGRMTEIVSQAIPDTPIAVALTNTLNNLTSAYSSRLAAYDEIVPWSIVALLFLSSMVPSFLTGLKHGEIHKLNAYGTLSFILMVGFVVFVTLDLNQPHRGLVTVNIDPLTRALQSLTP